jgi:hypothetical protein
MMGKKKTAKMMGGGTVKKTARMKGGGPVKKRAGGPIKKRAGGPIKKMAKGGINQHKRMAMGEAVNMKDGGTTMFSRGYGVGEKGKRMPTTILDGMKKGGSVKKKAGKKKQGYKDRKDESIAMRVKKKRTKKQLRASANESYGKSGSRARKKGKINR